MSARLLRPRWASSLLLTRNELFRLFGSHDWVLACFIADGELRRAKPLDVDDEVSDLGRAVERVGRTAKS